tara:strand:+ start:3597 stop:4694 length:1098 start_codon:yes stop_codon:yes gene_type:complete
MVVYDIPNLLVILIVIIASASLGFISARIALLLGLFAFAPFALNDVLFPASYMPDQFKYFNIVKSLRSGEFNNDDYASTVEFSGWIFSLLPLPFVETISSLGFYNRFLVTIIIIWLYSKKLLRGWPLLFVILYPSFILYSSLSLRDTLVFSFMIASVIFFIERRFMLSVLVSLPLIFIKFQNFFLIVVFYVVYLSFVEGGVFKKFRFIFLALTLLCLSPFITSIIESLNFYRKAMFFEDGGDSALYIPISSVSDFIILSVNSAPYFLLKPLPWEASNILQILQSIENILVLAFVYYLTVRANKVDKLTSMKWLIILLIWSAVYGLVVSNFGTAVRYKFPLVLTYVIGLSYDLKINYNFYFMRKKS